MAQAVEAEIGAGIWIRGLEALLTIGNCIATDMGRRGDIGWTIIVGRVTVITIGLRCANDRPADQCTGDTKANARAPTIAAAVSADGPTAPCNIGDDAIGAAAADATTHEPMATASAATRTPDDPFIAKSPRIGARLSPPNVTTRPERPPAIDFGYWFVMGLQYDERSLCTAALAQVDLQRAQRQMRLNRLREGHRLTRTYLAGRSMRHQRRHGHGLKHAARNSSQNALLKTRMAVASHDD